VCEVFRAAFTKSLLPLVGLRFSRVSCRCFALPSLIAIMNFDIEFYSCRPVACIMNIEQPLHHSQYFLIIVFLPYDVLSSLDWPAACVH